MGNWLIAINKLGAGFATFKKLKALSARLILYLLISNFLILSCAYYNTFYNAEKYYREGLNRQKTNPSQAKTSFDKAIEKSALVISKYPRSKYVSEALFIIGMSSYYTGEYTKAIAKFENLLLVFPKSKFVNEANLYWAAALIETKDYNSAIERLANLKQISMTKAIPKPLEEIASYKTAELYFIKKDYELAASEFKNFTVKFPKSEYNKDALLMLGDAERALKNYEAAITTYETYLKKLKVKSQTPKVDTASERIKGTLRIAECFIESDQETEGLKILDEIVGVDTLTSKSLVLDSKVYLELGKLFLRINNLEKARTYLKKVKNAPEIIEAYYLLGNSYESETKFDTAKIYYDSVVTRKTNSEYNALAQSRLELLKLVVRTLNSLIKDTMPVKIDTFVVKEDTLQEYLMPDTMAIDTLPLPEDTTVTKFDTIKPLVKIDTTLQTTKDTFSVVDSAAIQFHLAEIYNLNLKRYEQAIMEYNKVYEKYPTSNYAPKALFAEAWIYKNILGAAADTNSYNAKFFEVLNKIINEYPNTEYATRAQEMLNVTPKQP